MSAPRADAPATVQLSRATLAAAALAYTAFAIYGSWVPLNFRPIPFEQAIDRFYQIQWLNLGIGHRADWVANILLFVPLAFLWLGALWPAGVIGRLAASLLVWASAACLAVAIEFSQAWFPGRTQSWNDIVAECLGAAAGVVVWWAAGTPLSSWVAGLRRVSRPMGAIERILAACTAVVCLYALLPLDLTLSATEIYRKFMRGGIVLVPFTFHEARASYSVYSLLSEVLLWAPVGAFAAVRWAPAIAGATLRVAGLSALVECLQVFVNSRTVDVNDVIAAAAGGAIGAFAARRFGLTAATAGPRMPLPSGLATTLVLLALWAAGAALVFWFPFDFNFDRAFIRDRLDRVPRVLFASYYWGSEFNAATQVMRKMLYFVPLGALLAWGGVPLRHPAGRAVYMLVAAAVAAGAAVAIEVGQLGLTGKIVDPTDAMLAFLGAVAGWVMVSWIVRLTRGHRA